MTKKTIDKPWGKEVIWAQTKNYVGKVLHIKKGHRLSRQYHAIKEETIMVQSGKLVLEIGAQQYKKILELSAGEVFHVKPNTVHRFCAVKGDVVLLEVSTPELDDVVRLEDDYDRTN